MFSLFVLVNFYFIHRMWFNGYFATKTIKNKTSVNCKGTNCVYDYKTKDLLHQTVIRRTIPAPPNWTVSDLSPVSQVIIDATSKLIQLIGKIQIPTWSIEIQMEQKKVSFVSALGTVNLNLLILLHIEHVERWTFKLLHQQTKINMQQQ